MTWNDGGGDDDGADCAAAAAGDSGSVLILKYLENKFYFCRSTKIAKLNV